MFFSEISIFNDEIVSFEGILALKISMILSLLMISSLLVIMSIFSLSLKIFSLFKRILLPTSSACFSSVIIKGSISFFKLNLLKNSLLLLIKT